MSTTNDRTPRSEGLEELLARIAACRTCADALPHDPRPVVQAGHSARILVIGQAPGSKVHASGRAWDDDSGDRLRDWTGLGTEDFYDPERVAHMPSGFCYPGKGEGGDLPPRPECAPLWHDALRAELPQVRLTLLVGLHAQKRYLPRGFAPTMTQAVMRWREAPPGFLPLPHPAWRSRLWMARNPWFAAELLPDLRARIRAALD
ncbi:uracil-DNA glycosylase family protein [Novosphingobium mangrovi (ex Hu et al. 2023)]|uniref:Uracil-DNA glycosylase family protein n=1 Tax=Novosphingobium mangrovi (ex Hu et al. 2023) TaxID=2930094 RepID=A0ABT0AC74_9SPHN|nr:uracil-DNA glycosylase family protein [Novosphingobium mangrovi (ex Hu et al. 2023)]MCJ1960792.1 uracil-DNA glycosylase family protein [Novosphingobium mangrovi (ex Hu et al. 2023)]